MPSKLYRLLYQYKLLFMVAFTGVGFFLGYQYISVRLPVPNDIRELAQAGVQRNTDWQPLIRNVQGVQMALVPAGCFMMGSTEQQLLEAQKWCDRFNGVFGCREDFSIEQPSHQVCIKNPFWMDVVEISNGAYGGAAETDISPYPYYRDAGWPRETVTWQEAKAFCLQRGSRLPTEAEWEYAARGPDNLIYPWGNEFDPAMVNWHSGHPYDAGIKHEWVSWVGVYDMAGSIDEWVADWYGPYSEEAKNNPTGPVEGELHIARGGHWFSRVAHFWRTTSRALYDPGYASSTVGFRCVGEVGG
jgi:formylglycine-generating enzyme required for sulfatase activity